MPLPRSFQALRHPRYAALLAGGFISNIGTWMEGVAVGILVYETTGSGAWTGGVAAAAFIPFGLFGPLGGALADRLPRRELLLTSIGVQTLLAGVLTTLAATDSARPAAVAVVVFASGCAAAIALPAFQALTPELVPREDLPGAIALFSAQWNLGRVIGPALAGVAISAGGFEWAFAINTVSFLAVIVAIAPLRLPAPHPHGGESIRESIRYGLRFARREPGIRAALGYLAMNSFFAAPFIALVPAVAGTIFHHEKAYTPILVTAQGIGAVLMALSLGSLAARFGHRRFLLTAIGVLPVTLLLYALAPTFPVAVAAIFAVGFCYLGCLSGMMTVTQLRTSRELRGRVMSVMLVMIGVLYPLGSLVQGAVADEIGLRVTTAGAAIMLAAGIGWVRLRHPGYDRHLDEPDPETLPPETLLPEAQPPETPSPETLPPVAEVPRS